MRNADLKLSLPSEISDAFCAILDEYDIKHSVEKKVSKGPSFAVNSAQETAKEIVIELINSGAFWTAFSACFIAYINRNGKRKVTLKNGNKEISLENASHREVTEFIENANEVVFKDDGDKKPT
ncbi:hypothetical protein [Klebsiella grimontii]|uniref:hypothetical protein n=1 Tax=Klebsiella grimontii TaxID=2058152 RepID=UPI001CCB7311|nr:hypothetical protein [Klebsiella grimontii]MBZ7340637.1 hypothetical protein [Klebsiella grimontii]